MLLFGDHVAHHVEVLPAVFFQVSFHGEPRALMEIKIGIIKVFGTMLHL